MIRPLSGFETPAKSQRTFHSVGRFERRQQKFIPKSQRTGKGTGTAQENGRAGQKGGRTSGRRIETGNHESKKFWIIDSSLFFRQAKLTAAETLCEELMDENEDMKKELRELEEEIEEMQDNFREDQADEYSSLKKELEQTTKNCRILSFKLRKSERKAEQLELEKIEAEKKYKEVSIWPKDSS